MTQQLTIYGAPYSVYVKIVRLALLEKGVDYTLKPIDIFNKNGVPQSYLKRHPFGKIPTFTHGGVQIYETAAIIEYIDSAFPEPKLMPEVIVERAKARQLISIFDNYAYQSMVWGIYVTSQEPNPDNELKQKLPRQIKIAETTIKAVTELAVKNEAFFMGQKVMLPDLYALPMIDYFIKTDIGKNMVSDNKRLQTWWETINSRPGYQSILDDE